MKDGRIVAGQRAAIMVTKAVRVHVGNCGRIAEAVGAHEDFVEVVDVASEIVDDDA